MMDLKSLLFEENVGGLDLMLKSAVGTLALLALALYRYRIIGAWMWLLALIAFVGVFTSLTRHCTPYVLFGFSTAKKRE